MANTSIPLFKAALVTRLLADTALGAATPAVQVTYGIPFPADPQREWVMVGDIQGSWHQNYASIGQLKRDEEYSLMLLVSVIDDIASSQQVITERAFTIAAAIENSIRSWGGPGVGDPWNKSTTNVWVAEVTGSQFVEQANTKIREAAVTLQVTCKARI